MEHQAQSQVSNVQRRTYYQGVMNTTDKGVVFVDELEKGYKEFFYERRDGEIEILFVIRYFTSFSNRIAGVKKELQPRQVSALDILEFLKAYKNL